MASRLLSVLPKCLSFTYESSSFRILLCNRLYLPQPERCEGLRCDCIHCGEHPVIDEWCHHLVTGCAKSEFVISLVTWMVSYYKLIDQIVYLVLISNNLPFLFAINFANKKAIDSYWEILKTILSLLLQPQALSF